MTTQFFLGAGQSNCVGDAEMADIPVTETFLRYTDFDVDQIMRLGDSDDHPVWADYGPGSLAPRAPISGGAATRVETTIAMGRALRQYYGPQKVKMGRFACSSTLISSWLPGAAPLPGEATALYAQMMTWLAASLVATGGVLTGFWWMQGNADAATQANADQYAARMATLFTAVRADSGHPTLRIVYDQLSPNCTKAFKDTVRAQQAAYAATDPLSRMIPTDASYTLRDGDHITAGTFMRLGWDYADRFLSQLTPISLQGDVPL